MIYTEESSAGVIVYSTDEAALATERAADVGRGLRASRIYWADWMGRFQYEVRD